MTSPSPNAVELPVGAAWYLADAVRAGSYPWVLAVTPPERAVTTEQLIRLGVLDASTGRIDPAVADWVRLVCHPERWLELRCVTPSSKPEDLLRGFVARRGDRTVVALRNAQLITLTAIAVDEPHALVPILTAGLAKRPPARFAEFMLPARVGARADEQLRNGAELSSVLDYLGIAGAARDVVASVFTGPRSYVEIVAGQNRDGVVTTSEVGVAVVDAAEGRVVVSPEQAHDGEWISTFAPGTPWSISLAVENLTATLPDGRWFPAARLSRDFTARSTH